MWGLILSQWRSRKIRSLPIVQEIRGDLGSKRSFCNSFWKFLHSESLYYMFIFLFHFIFVFVCIFWISAAEKGVSKEYSGIFAPDRYQCSLSFRIWKLENLEEVWNSWWRSLHRHHIYFGVWMECSLSVGIWKWSNCLANMVSTKPYLGLSMHFSVLIRLHAWNMSNLSIRSLLFTL